MNRRFKGSRARFGLVVLAGALVVMALAPATASASPFERSTKVCNQPGVCALTIDVDFSVFEYETITIDLDPRATGATFQRARRTGGDCPRTAVSLVDSTTVHLDPSANLDGPCTIVLEETLAAQSSGEVCQTIILRVVGGSVFDPPPQTVCAQLTAAHPCTITGTRGNDVIRGTSGRDVICAGDGNNVVYGRGGNDIIRGGNGHDVLRGGDANDIIRGGDGNDLLRGGGGEDRVIGGPGNDSLHGNRGADSLHAQDAKRGNDGAHGGPGADSCTADPRDVRSSC